METKRLPRWQVGFRLDAIALRNLEAIETQTGESVAALMIRLIREEYERLLAERGPAIEDEVSA